MHEGVEYIGAERRGIGFVVRSLVPRVSVHSDGTEGKTKLSTDTRVVRTESEAEVSFDGRPSRSRDGGKEKREEEAGRERDAECVK